MEPSSAATEKLPTANASASGEPSTGLIRGLSLLDSVLLLAGGIIGSSIFLTAKDIAGPLPHPALFFLVWVIGAMISMCAAFAFAELGSMFPDSGGQYIYLREAFGDLVAFLYGWMLFAVANGGTIAALSVASAAYLGAIFPAISDQHVIVSVAGITLTRVHVVALISIVVVTWINVIGLRREPSCRTSRPGQSSSPWAHSSFLESCSARETGATSRSTAAARPPA